MAGRLMEGPEERLLDYVEEDAFWEAGALVGGSDHHVDGGEAGGGLVEGRMVVMAGVGFGEAVPEVEELPVVEVEDFLGPFHF